MKINKRFTLSLSKGFTLIELLVVIAIIGILSSVVIASLNRARDRAADAKVKAQLAQVKDAAEIYFNQYADYGLATDLCDNMFVDPDSGMIPLTTLSNYQGAINITCRSTNIEYAISVTLPSDITTFWCVDSVGSAQENAADLSAGDATCN